MYDGVDTSSALIGQLCGTNYFIELTSTGPEVLVEFTSQGYIPAKGFRAEFAFISTTVPSSPPTDFWQHFPGKLNKKQPSVGFFYFFFCFLSFPLPVSVSFCIQSSLFQYLIFGSFVLNGCEFGWNCLDFFAILLHTPFFLRC